MLNGEDAIYSHGHRFGNYHDYYFFHPSSIRTALIPNGIFKDMHRNNSNNNDTITTFNVLDIGCNEGDLTIDIYNRIRSEVSTDIDINVIGIDIDPTLIDRAKQKAFNSISMNDTIQFIAKDIMNNNDCNAKSNTDTNTDINTDTNANAIISNKKFHFVSIFSVTMWIHLNHGNFFEESTL